MKKTGMNYELQIVQTHLLQYINVMFIIKLILFCYFVNLLCNRVGIVYYKLYKHIYYLFNDAIKYVKLVLFSYLTSNELRTVNCFII